MQKLYSLTNSPHLNLDVDECATNDGGCDSKRKCVNTVGSMSCDDCPAGYTNYGAKGCKGVCPIAGAFDQLVSVP